MSSKVVGLWPISYKSAVAGSLDQILWMTNKPYLVAVIQEDTKEAVNGGWARLARGSSWNTFQANKIAQKPPSQDKVCCILHQNAEWLSLLSNAWAEYNVTDLLQANDAAARKE